jgi:hypothetical protein
LPAGALKTSPAFSPSATDLISVTESDKSGLFVRWTLSPDVWTATACRTAPAT